MHYLIYKVNIIISTIHIRKLRLKICIILPVFPQLINSAAKTWIKTVQHWSSIFNPWDRMSPQLISLSFNTWLILFNPSYILHTTHTFDFLIFLCVKQWLHSYISQPAKLLLFSHPLLHLQQLITKKIPSDSRSHHFFLHNFFQGLPR